MRKNWKGAAAVFAAVASVIVIVLAGCTQPTTAPPSGGAPATADNGPVTVGSKIDTEGKLLGTIIIKVLENNGLKVVDKTQTGQTDVVRKALINKEIDIYPEYTGSGLIFFKDQDPAIYKDPEKGYEQVKKLDLEQNSVVWLTPAKANNTWAIAVKKEFAAANSLKTISDMAAYVKAGKAAKMIASDEFFNNADAWPAFQAVYGFDLSKDQRVTLSGGNTAQTEKAVADGTNGVNFGMAYGTDGALADLGLVVLADDKEAQLVYWPVPIANKAIIDKYPQIKTWLQPVFDSLDLAKLQELNARIQVNGEAADVVATDYLTKNGFIK